MTSYRKQNFDDALPFLLPMLEIAFNKGQEQGFANGFKAGELLGYIQGINALKPAISDGLRCGSSECGKAMQSIKNLGLDASEEDNKI